MKRLIFFFLISLNCFSLHAQKVLKGRVSSKENQPLVGVSIIVKGTTTGTTTNENGAFEFAVPDNAKKLVFSFVGFKSYEMKYSGQSTVRVTLEEDVKTLGEITVKGFADTKGRARKSGAIEKYSLETNIRLEKGDIVRCVTATGGGYGPPSKRHKEWVLQDIKNGYITKEQAKEFYKVES